MLKKTKILAGLLGLCLMAGPAFADAPVNDKLPDPDGKPADMTKPVKVFIIMGQSNTLEYGILDAKKPRFKPKDGLGEQELAKAKKKYEKQLANYEASKTKTLKHAINNEGLYPFMVDDNGDWTVRKDVRQVYVMQGRGVQRNDWLSVNGGRIGMDQGIGHQLGNHFDEPVMVLRSSIGNRSLGWDLLPPGSERYEHTEFNKKENREVTYVYPGYKDEVRHSRWEKGNVPEPPKHGWYAGKQYDDDVANAKKVLADLNTYYPEAGGYEVAGFLWWQGCKDRGNAGHYNRYEQNLKALLTALRKDFNAPEAKLVAASLGEDKMGVENGGGKILQAIMNLANPEKHADLKGDVAGVYTHPLAIPPGESCGHYGNSAKTYMNVGLAMGEAMVDLFSEDK
ncbi:MAG: sialate O-acetylesterase [Phycisphaeraceae bacterium]|nr:sialate O-acetylesterase [Phycisphaeraceae bacterium]